MHTIPAAALCAMAISDASYMMVSAAIFAALPAAAADVAVAIFFSITAPDDADDDDDDDRPAAAIAGIFDSWVAIGGRRRASLLGWID
jgi:hypothetical protein